MQNLYVYIENENLENAVKYGMKLSIYANKVIVLGKNEKKGITAYLSPKDSPLYHDPNYTCLRITIENDLKVYIYNQICENTSFFGDYILPIQNYLAGTFETPVAFICSTILPDNIFIYNKILDIPLLIESSKEFYYEKAINDMIENDQFTKSELYQMLLILGEQKSVFQIEQNENKVKIYKDIKSGKTYTRKSSF